MFRIVLVEDNDDEVVFIKEALSERIESLEVVVMGDGADAIEYLREHAMTETQPDLVLLDLDLPTVSGHEVLEQVKSDPIMCEIPIIVLTTSRARADVHRAYRAHANAFIQKPRAFEDYDEVARRIQAFWLELVTLPTNPGKGSSR